MGKLNAGIGIFPNGLVWCFYYRNQLAQYTALPMCDKIHQMYFLLSCGVHVTYRTLENAQGYVSRCIRRLQLASSSEQSQDETSSCTVTVGEGEGEGEEEGVVPPPHRQKSLGRSKSPPPPSSGNLGTSASHASLPTTSSASGSVPGLSSSVKRPGVSKQTSQDTRSQSSEAQPSSSKNPVIRCRYCHPNTASSHETHMYHLLVFVMVLLSNPEILGPLVFQRAPLLWEVRLCDRVHTQTTLLGVLIRLLVRHASPCKHSRASRPFQLHVWCMYQYFAYSSPLVLSNPSNPACSFQAWFS